MNEWISCGDMLPPDGKNVATKIDDANGVRNVVSLVRRGNLWWQPDFSSYVYYHPTHWRELTAEEK